MISYDVVCVKVVFFIAKSQACSWW